MRIDDLATIMYTSGTTGTPKGIQFSHRNIVFKRFARALALPEIGENDVFLCFLPLFHTFGRFLEMLGCVFWGATYCFLGPLGPQGAGPRHACATVRRVHQRAQEVDAALRGDRPRPTRSRSPTRSCCEATRSMTGGRLRWGLSAAGHLDPDIFRFFQHQGIELMSGFGMTEATGGITMTPPGGLPRGLAGRRRCRGSSCGWPTTARCWCVART